MEVILIVCLALVLCASNVACFVIGAKVGQKVQRGEEITLPSFDPLKSVREHEARKEAKAERERVDTILENIENYDGTDRGQKDIPRRRD